MGKIEEMKLAEKPPPRLEEFEDEDAPAGFGDSCHLLKAQAPIFQIADSESHRNDIEGILFKGKGERVGQGKVGTASPLPARIFLLGEVDHFGTEVGTNDRARFSCKSKTEIARARTEIENSACGIRTRCPNRRPSPPPIDLEGEKVIEQIVAPRDSGEHEADLLGFGKAHSPDYTGYYCRQ